MQINAKSLQLLFAVGIVLSAIIFIPLQSFSFTLPKLFVLSITALTGAILLMRSDHSIISPLIDTWTGRFATCFFITVVLSLTWSLAPMLSTVGAPPRYEGLLTYAVYFTLFVTSIALSQERSNRKILVITIMLSNALVILYGALQVLHLDPFAALWEQELFLGRIFSTIGQPNFLGQFILLTVPFMGFMAAQSSGAKRMFFMILSVLNIIILLATASRAALLGFLVMLFFAWMMGMSTLRNKSALSLSIAAIFFLIIAVFFFAQRFSVSTQEGTSLGARSVIWNSSLEAIRVRPLGYGLETTGQVLPRFMSPELYQYESLTTKIDRAHSKPLDLLITLGPLGLFTYYGFLLLLLASLWRTRDPPKRMIFLSLIGFSISLLFGFEGIFTHAVFWLVAGIALGLFSESHTHTRKRGELFFICALIVIVFLSTVASAQWLRARVSMERGEQQLTQWQLDEAVRSYAYGSALFPFDRQLLIQSIEAALIAGEHAGDLSTKEKLMKFYSNEVVKLEALTSQEDGMVPLLRAWQSALEGDAAGAERLIADAREKQPVDITTYRIAAHSFQLLGDEENVKAMYLQLIELLPSFWQDSSSERGRILWKEHPWLEEVLP